MARPLVWVGCALAILLVGLPRAASSRNIAPPPMRPDGFYYAEMVQFFRGERVEPIDPPFAYRVAGPWLAAQLPLVVHPIDALNALNYCALLLSAVLLHAMVRRGRDDAHADTAAALFVLSFPTAYYGMIGYVDPLALLLVVSIVALVGRGHLWLAAGTLLLGMLVKETVAVALAPIVVRALSRRRSDRYLLIASAAGGVFLGWSLARWLAPAGPVDFRWTPATLWIEHNLLRPRFWISNLLSIGVPGALVGIRAWSVRAWRCELVLNGWLWAGVAASCALALAAISVAHSDGRFVWYLYPSAIPLYFAPTTEDRGKVMAA